MRILLTGASGQVGFQLERSLQSLGEVLALRRAQMDLADLDQVRDTIRAVRPQLIVNAAAYTAVDQAQSEPALAQRINAEAPAVMAAEAARLGAAMVHYSTDYVFDGAKQGAYTETDVPNPVNVYGKSKLAGEQALAAAGIPHLILRTSWVYGVRGRNFLLTMLRLCAERNEVSVVADQHGSPTWSRTVADTTAAILGQARAGGESWWEDNSGLYHLSCPGQTSWAEFAQAIIDTARLECAVIPIGSADYPAIAQRPLNSVLSCDKLLGRFCAIPDWRQALALCMARAG